MWTENFDEKKYFYHYGNGSSSNAIPILDMEIPYLSKCIIICNHGPIGPVIALAYIALSSVSAVLWICQTLSSPNQSYSWHLLMGGAVTRDFKIKMSS